MRVFILLSFMSALSTTTNLATKVIRKDENPSDAEVIVASKNARAEARYSAPSNVFASKLTHLESGLYERNKKWQYVYKTELPLYSPELSLDRVDEDDSARSVKSRVVKKKVDPKKRRAMWRIKKVQNKMLKVATILKKLRVL